MLNFCSLSPLPMAQSSKSGSIACPSAAMPSRRVRADLLLFPRTTGQVEGDAVANRAEIHHYSVYQREFASHFHSGILFRHLYESAKGFLEPALLCHVPATLHSGSDQGICLVRKPCGRLLKGTIADLQIKLIYTNRNWSILRARDLYPESINCFAARGKAKPPANIQPALFGDGYSILDPRVLRENKTC